MFKQEKAYLQQNRKCNSSPVRNPYNVSGLALTVFLNSSLMECEDNSSLMECEDPSYAIFDSHAANQLIAEINFKVNSESRPQGLKPRRRAMTYDMKLNQLRQADQQNGWLERLTLSHTGLSSYGVQYVKSLRTFKLRLKARSQGQKFQVSFLLPTYSGQSSYSHKSKKPWGLRGPEDILWLSSCDPFHVAYRECWKTRDNVTSRTDWVCADADQTLQFEQTLWAHWSIAMRALFPQWIGTFTENIQNPRVLELNLLWSLEIPNIEAIVLPADEPILTTMLSETTASSSTPERQASLPMTRQLLES